MCALCLQEIEKDLLFHVKSMRLHFKVRRLCNNFLTWFGGCDKNRTSSYSLHTAVISPPQTFDVSNSIMTCFRASRHPFKVPHISVHFVGFVIGFVLMEVFPQRATDHVGLLEWHWEGVVNNSGMPQLEVQLCIILFLRIISI